MKPRIAAMLCLCAISAISLSVPMAIAQVGGGPAAPAQGQPITVRGSITSFNLNARGLPESFMLIAGTQAGQVNFNSALTDTLSRVLKIGDVVEVTLTQDASAAGGGGGRGRGAQADHAVYNLVSLKDATGKDYTNPTTPDLNMLHLAGVIAAVNYDHNGAPNGVQLSTGDMIRFSPRDAQGLSLTRGAQISADGPADQMVSGRYSVTATTLNGTAGGPPAQLAGQGGGGRGRGGGGGGRGRRGGGGAGGGGGGGGGGGNAGGGYAAGGGGGQPMDNGGGGYDPNQDAGGGGGDGN